MESWRDDVGLKFRLAPHYIGRFDIVDGLGLNCRALSSSSIRLKQISVIHYIGI